MKTGLPRSSLVTLPDPLVVENISRTLVPLGGGPAKAGLGVNEQDEAAGSPEQLSGNERFEPGAAISVSGMLIS
jgi:hypothetical protein